MTTAAETRFDNRFNREFGLPIERVANKIADAAIEGRFQDMKMLVDEFKDFETKKPPAVSLPAWERGAF